MVRATGSLSDEKSVTGPTSAPLSCVVRRIKGNSVKRISGTASSAPTQKDPKASKAPRNDRRFSEAGPELSAVVIIRTFQRVAIRKAGLFFCHCANVGDQGFDHVR